MFRDPQIGGAFDEQRSEEAGIPVADVEELDEEELAQVAGGVGEMRQLSSETLAGVGEQRISPIENVMTSKLTDKITRKSGPWRLIAVAALTQRVRISATE